MIIPAGHVLKSAYLPLLEIVFPLNGAPMAIASVKEKIDHYSSIGPGQTYPLPIGKWVDGRFHLWDGRHRYIASLMMGRSTMLVGWVEPA